MRRTWLLTLANCSQAKRRLRRAKLALNANSLCRFGHAVAATENVGHHFSIHSYWIRNRSKGIRLARLIASMGRFVKRPDQQTPHDQSGH